MGGGREVQERGTYVYLWLIHVNIWQKPAQYCTTIILQLKINEKVTSVYLRTFKFFVVVLVPQSCLSLCDPMDFDPSDPSVHGIFPGRYTGVGCLFLLGQGGGDLPGPGMELVTPVLAGIFFTTEPPGKPFKPLLEGQFFLLPFALKKF